MSHVEISPAAGGLPLAFAQQYTISTVAGGAPPPLPRRPPARPSASPAESPSIPPATSISAAAIRSSSWQRRHAHAGGGQFARRLFGRRRPRGQCPVEHAAGPGVRFRRQPLHRRLAEQSRPHSRLQRHHHHLRRQRQTSFGGGPGSYNDGGPATKAPTAPAHRASPSIKSGNVYIADTGDNIIRKVTTDGIINTFAGRQLSRLLRRRRRQRHSTAEFTQPVRHRPRYPRQPLHRRHRQRRHSQDHHRRASSAPSPAHGASAPSGDGDRPPRPP